jgi:HEAT repeat protein
VLQAFPQDLLVDSLKEAAADKLQIPATILNLLAKLKQHQNMGKSGTRIVGESQLDADQIQERMHLIFREEDNGKFIPEAYQHALHTIVTSEQLSLNDQEEIGRLRCELDASSVERQTGAIAFEILQSGAKPELKQTLERNLIDLARFFLETGDFKALEDLYQRWHNILERSGSNATILNEELLTSLHGEEFIAGTLAAFDVYGKKKQDEIRQYILTVGEPFAHGLIQRLATSESQAQRQFFLACLEQMGSRAHPEIFKALDDERWYLVRNLIGILAKSRNPVALKRIFPLLEHPHPQVRQRVLKLMLNFNRPRAERQLLAELQSTSTSELLFAVRIAHLCHDQAIRQQLLRLLRHPSFKAEFFELKVEILKTLARTGDAEVVSTLEDLLKAADLRHPLQSRRFKLEIVKTLGQYPAARVRPLLERLIERGGKETATLATEQLRHLIRSQS